MLLQERTKMCRAALYAAIKAAMRELEDAARKKKAEPAGSKRPRKLSIPLARVKKIMQQALKNPNTHITNEAVLTMTYARPIHGSSMHAPAAWVALPPAAPAAPRCLLASGLQCPSCLCPNCAPMRERGCWTMAGGSSSCS